MTAFVWDVELMDTTVGQDASCDWTWDLTPEELQGLLAFLVHCSQLTWSELQQQTTGGRTRHKKHHDMDVEALPKPAQQRLATHMENHGSEPPEKLFRLRYGGKERVWGVRDRAKWHMIWADPEHRIYPTDPNP